LKQLHSTQLQSETTPPNDTGELTHFHKAPTNGKSKYCTLASRQYAFNISRSLKQVYKYTSHEHHQENACVCHLQHEQLEKSKRLS